MPGAILLPRQFLAGTIIQCGTEANKKEWLPGMRTGEIRMVLGYSEPDSGTDLASLKTRAVRTAMNGLYPDRRSGTAGPTSEPHEWLAVRTNPDVPNRQGISLIIVPIDSRGVSIQEIKTWGDYRTNIVFFDDVRVPYSNLIGEVNRGLAIHNRCARNRRVSLGVPVASKHVVEVISDVVLSEEHCTAARAETVIRMQAEYEVARLLAYRAGSLVDNGYTGSPLPQMSKVFTTEMRSRIGDDGMDLLQDKSLSGIERHQGSSARSNSSTGTRRSCFSAAGRTKLCGTSSSSSQGHATGPRSDTTQPIQLPMTMNDMWR